MARKQDNNYFKMFEDMAACALDAAKTLEEILTGFSYEDIEQSMKRMHIIENAGDLITHDLKRKLAKEFITPIDREDILAIAGQIDDITDSIEDVILKIYMFNIKSIAPDAIAFIGIVRSCCEELQKMLRELPNFRKSKDIHPAIVHINQLEGDGDNLYTEAVHRLFSEDNSAMTAFSWAQIYSCFEKCCDNCEHTANVVESIIMKNS